MVDLGADWNIGINELWRTDIRKQKTENKQATLNRMFHDSPEHMFFFAFHKDFQQFQCFPFTLFRRAICIQGEYNSRPSEFVNLSHLMGFCKDLTTALSPSASVCCAYLWGVSRLILLLYVCAWGHLAAMGVRLALIISVSRPSGQSSLPVQVKVEEKK